MEYIGEHLLPGNLGRLFVIISFAGALISALAYFFAFKKNSDDYRRLGRISFTTHTIATIGIVSMLFYIMLSHYFEYNYVWQHTSLDLPFKYIFSAFWEGQEGSFIIWMFWHSILGVLLMLTAKKWENTSMLVYSLVQVFIASMVLGVYIGDVKIGSSPFILTRLMPENIGLPWTQSADYLQKFPAFMDGTGLNPLLQNYWMTIHPPTLFLGFASALPPFALAVGALINKDFSGWVKPAIPWTYFSVMILGTGILMGGAWAYEALSFGGFWAWDPVENASLVPWLTMVATAHLLLIYKNRKTALNTTFFMVIFTFILVVYSTYLNRSGVLGDSSVHAFVDLGLNAQLLSFLFFFILFPMGLFLYRYKHIPKNKKDDELSSKEFWMFIGGLVLLIASFQIIFSTSIPVFNKLIGPEGVWPLMKDKMAPPIDAIAHYNSFQVPFAIVVTLLIAFSQYLNYKSSNSKKFWKRMLWSSLVAIALTALVSSIYGFWQQPLYLSLLFVSFLAIVTNIDYWFFTTKRQWKFSGSTIAHIGFALIMIGTLISNAKQEVISHTDVFLSDDLPSSENALLELGDTTELGEYIAIWNGRREELNREFYDVDYYKNTPQGLVKDFTLTPNLVMADNMGPSPNPSTKHYWHKDVYTHVTYSSYLEPVSPDGYGNEMVVELSRGDTALYQQHFVIMDSLKVNAAYHEETGALQVLRLMAKITIVNVLGEEFKAQPVYILDGNEVSYEDAYMDTQKFKFRLEDINTENGKIVLKAYTEVGDEKPFIVMKAIIFPMINILWMGCILMAIGSGIAVWQRIKKS